MAQDLRTRFWSKVNIASIDECWRWQGAKANNGYGHMDVQGKTISAHRLAFEFSYDDLALLPGLEVCHTCDNRACVNPTHLFLGYRQTNVNDMWRKGRGSCNERHPNAVYSNDLVLELRRRFATGGISKRQLAKELGISYTHAVSILNGKRRPEYVPARDTTGGK